jgi:16S rRNA processing protein RimM
MAMRVRVGTVSKPHGIKGEVKVLSDTYDRAVFGGLKSVYIDGKPYGLESVRLANAFVILKLKGIDGIDAADLFRSKAVEIDKKDRLPLPADMFYINDLVGCGVYVGLNRIGELKGVLQNGAADVYIVRGENGDIMFPALKDLLLRVDIGNKIIALDEKRFGETAVMPE